MELKDISNLDDRYLLLLLTHRSKDEELIGEDIIEYERLKSIYIDSNDKESKLLLKSLEEKGLLVESEFKSFWVYNTEFKICVGYSITKEGILAISNGLFTSESKQRINKSDIEELQKENLRLSNEAHQYQASIRELERWKTHLEIDNKEYEKKIRKQNDLIRYWQIGGIILTILSFLFGLILGFIKA